MTPTSRSVADTVRQFDLVIVGAGSGNMIPSPEMDDWRIAIVEKDVFGGTCLNRGCIPSKMLIHPADVAHEAATSAHLGVHTRFEGVDLPALVDRVFGRIDPIAAGGEAWRADLPNFEVIKAEGRFVDHHVMRVGDGERDLITAPRWILAAGARPFVPPIPGLDEVAFHTSDTIMRLQELPRRLVIVGGGYIALELGHVFGAFGSEVTFLLRGDRMLRSADAEISDRATAAYTGRFDVRTGCRIVAARHDGRDVTLDVERHGGPVEPIEGDVLLVAAGRLPNSDVLQVDRTGVATHPDGRVVVDDTLATGVDGIWAFGDLTNSFQLKHLANAEARVVAHNVLHPDTPRRVEYTTVPSAVFGSPQIAMVGLTEDGAHAAGVDYATVTKPYGDTAWGWALDDERSVIKLIARRDDRRLIGAHLIGPQASTLIQQLVQGMNAGQTVDEMAHGQIWIHPAPTEVVENALLDLATVLDASSP